MSLPTHSLAAAVALQPTMPKVAEGQKQKRQYSECGSPVAITWAIAHSMRLERPDVPRKVILAELDRAGVAHHTAKTQLQAYLKHMKDEAARIASMTPAAE